MRGEFFANNFARTQLRILKHGSSPWPVTVTALRRAARPAGDSETSFLLLSQPGPGTRTTD